MNHEKKPWHLRNIEVSKKRYTLNNGVVRFDSITHAGWIRITDIGQENLYFDFTSDAGEALQGYCKCL